MFKYDQKTVALSLKECIERHQKELAKDELRQNKDNWIYGISENLVKYCLSEMGKYNKNLAGSYRLEEEDLIKVLHKAYETMAKLILSKKIKS